MPRIKWDADMEDFDSPEFEPMRRDNSPVSGRHDMQRRAEDGINRGRKAEQIRAERRNAEGRKYFI